MPDTPMTIEEILGPDGLLARFLDGFEFRPSQLAMANLIWESIDQKMPAIVEAGTGTGKTLGYLVPIVLSGKKAVISTGTKNLQEQIFHKDIPLLAEATGLSIDAMIMKGRRNYLCLHKYHQFFSQSSLFTGLSEVKQRLEQWLINTSFADRAEIPWMADDDTLWDALSSTSDQCLGPECIFASECYLGRLRSKAAKTRIIIVNHHLFFSDLKVKQSGFGEIIPRFQAALFDEAHDIEEIGTTYLGESFSSNQLSDLTSDLEKRVKGLHDPSEGKLKIQITNIKAAIEELKTLFDERPDKGILDHETLSAIGNGPARRISRGLKSLYELFDGTGLSDDDPSSDAVLAQGNVSLYALALRAAELERLLDQILWKRSTDWLNWYEKRKKSLVLHVSPLNISEKMKELLYQKVQTIIFTSATLSTNGNFDYIRSRLDLPGDAIEGIFPSHFDFMTQTLLYVPDELPAPGHPDFGPEIAQRILDLIEITQGRALVLFTSYHNMNLVWNILKDKIPYTILKQGDSPRSVLLDSFRHDIHSVLLGTSSFWQGVDVPGESLSCLIIDKLPFDSPGEPLVAAKINAIREQGKNPFMEYQLPSAIIALKQGMGRLIRKGTDRGVLAVLDNRIIKSRYGKFFLNSLPKIPISHKLSDISSFFEDMKGEA
ncbi:putative DnaQ family exonuclease/DinG family helicase [uncultured Desulfobacterium sp.]|uniref:Putative DnaQ family exonuclease/DinG family helicase n=1 Tax=uncultured Desulfobacterium sp. TaxID=201089 RepID=A0A445MW44_9BACT|nr:putative DnaQ family exonuclease/DinG family helicase [uncultured Desulfobacterium sp.]